MLQNRNEVEVPVTSLRSPTHGYIIEQKQHVKLLGCPIENDLSFDKFMAKRKKSGFDALWKLRRLARHGVSKMHLKNVYTTYVRSSMEYGLVAAYPALKQGQLDALESVQQRATWYIFGMGPFRKPNDISYEDRLKELGLEKLEKRTFDRFEKFCKKIEHDPQITPYIVPRPPSKSSMMLRNRRKYKEID